MKKINIGNTNISYKKGNFFYQEKIKNGFNHLTSYEQLNKFDFVPKLIENNDNYSIWEWIEGDNLLNPDDQDLIKIANILKKIHSSNLIFSKFNIRKRIRTYLGIMNNKGIKIEIIDNLYRKINLILSKMDKKTPIHGDLWQYNLMKTKDNKIYLIDWEYSIMGDIHYELAYFIESYRLNEKQELVFLNAYKNYDAKTLKNQKILVNYLTVLWLFSQEKLPFSPDYCLERIKFLLEN